MKFNPFGFQSQVLREFVFPSSLPLSVIVCLSPVSLHMEFFPPREGPAGLFSSPLHFSPSYPLHCVLFSLFSYEFVLPVIGSFSELFIPVLNLWDEVSLGSFYSTIFLRMYLGLGFISSIISLLLCI